MNQKTLTFERALKENAPDLTCAIIECDLTNTKNSDTLWDEIRQVEEGIRSTIKIPDVKNIAAIAATREAYKKCGKDPNRYRPSAEQLNRRILQGKDLYRISVLVDLVNLVSLKSGYSIGGFDADKIEGNLIYGIGLKDEQYRGIGRGFLNIEGLPVLRDGRGGIGTPTSDEERTMIHLNTRRFLMNINAYSGDDAYLHDTIHWSVHLLKNYVAAENVTIRLFS